MRYQSILLLVIFILSIFTSTLSKKRNKVYVSSYLNIVNYPQDDSDIDYHQIEFIQNSLPFLITDQMSYFSANESPAKLRIGDDNATYPNRAVQDPVLSSDITSSDTSSKNINTFKKLLPTFDLFHHKCYVAWDVTRKTQTLNAVAGVNKVFYNMKIKYFNSLTTMNSFYNSISSDIKFSQCGLKNASQRFKVNFNNNGDFEVSKIYPLVLNYYSCSNAHYLSLATPITNSTCQNCPVGQKPSEDRLSCVTVTNNNHLILIHQSYNLISGVLPLAPTLVVYSFVSKAIVTDNADEAAILYSISPAQKIYINNSTPVLVSSSGAQQMDPNVAGTPATASLNTYGFNPNFHSLSACTSSIGIFQFVYERTNGEVTVNTRMGAVVSELMPCFVWYDNRDAVLDADYTLLGNYEPVPDSPTGEAVLSALEGRYKTYPTGGGNTWLGPSSQFDNDYTNKPFVLYGPYYCTIDVELDPDDFGEGDGMDFTCANSNFDPTPGVTSAPYGSEHVFHIYKTSGTFRIATSQGSSYLPKVISDAYLGVKTIIPSGTAKQWYTFKHNFRNDAGVMKVDMTVTNGSSTQIFSETLTTGSIATKGSSRNYRFIFINNISKSVRIRNFNRVFTSSPLTTSQSTNKCDFKYARSHVCIPGLGLLLVTQYNKDERYEKYLPKYVSIDYSAASTKKPTGY